MIKLLYSFYKNRVNEKIETWDIKRISKAGGDGRNES